jgi:hypothetical protein
MSRARCHSALETEVRDENAASQRVDSIYTATLGF